MKVKFLMAIALVTIFFASCHKKNNKIPFDPTAQAVTDNDSLVIYMQTHYLNTDGNLWTVTNGETPLMDQVTTQNIVRNGINYKLYYLNENEGETIAPSRADSILVTYKGYLLDSTKFDFRNSPTWFSLTGLIEGWKYGMVHFKGGNKLINPDESFSYTNSGQGILFIPSGLAYENSTSGIVGKNKPIIFQFKLDQVQRADHDNDGILSINEDLNNNGEVDDDDTDGDGIPNYLDRDDDNDGVLTRNEDANKDGNPADDDTDNDGVPDYLEKSVAIDYFK